jgi:hypothetical protein
MILGKRFLDAYAKLLTWIARVFGALCGLASLMTLITTLATPDASPWMYLLVLIMAGICIATFLAKPIRGSDIGGITEDSMGSSHVSALKQNQSRGGSDLDVKASSDD